MATKKATKQAPKELESIAGKEGRIKTEVLITNPKTVITITGNLPQEVSAELRLLVDGLLKERGL